MTRYLRLLLIQIRASLLLTLQYRFDFFVQGFTSLFWTATTFVPIVVVFNHREAVAGWSWGEALLVLGFFMLLKSVLEGAVNPSLLTVVDHIRKGTLDFVLLKPADAQFLVSTAKFDTSALVGAGGAIALLSWAIVEVGHAPTAGGVLVALLLLAASVGLLYSMWILVVSAAFHVVKIDNLSYLLQSIFDAARWPSAVFRGAWHVLFTFVIPLALMTTWPAEALLGRLDPVHAAAGLFGTLVLALAARAVWLASIGKYTSASS